ncbi:FtsX-like permease family protein [Ilyomonas limi]|uniref:FtsX-like permease family protein n=1 Tax=Ilyomonas limi TaxID=2575867 RepID=A0A4V6XAV3_9BACT|nr:ABC transporter permease [Ilyomonas limi]TKK68253.1 FtsX-like permease family protein [Ilyomonas limi]
MLRNYLQIAYRTLTKNKTYSLINIFGLAISLTASILLLLWVWDELSFDKFNEKIDRLYTAAPTFDKDRKQVWGTTPAPLATFAKQQIPAVENAVRISDNGDILMQYNDKKFDEKRTAYADPSLFTIFSFPVIEGSAAKPFTDNRSMVISQTTAKKYFGNEDAVGKVIKVNNKDNFTVTGVFKDMPQNSSVRYDIVMPFSILNEGYTADSYWKGLDADWGNYNYNTFFLIKPGTDAALLGKQLADVHRKNQQEDFIKDLYYVMQPLKNVHLYTPTGEDNGVQVVKIFFVIAIVILLIACINYINLVTARATKRAKEVSVRKVIGAGKKQLFWQFITESLLVFIIAMVLSLVIIYAIMPFYNELSGKNLIFNFYDGRVLVLYACALLVTVLFAGIYPALTLSSFNPAVALKGLIPGLGKNAVFRKMLVVVQFTCSIILIISTVIIGQQLKYIRQKNLGFDKENIITFNGRKFADHYDAIKAELEKVPGITSITAGSNDIMNIQSSTGDAEWDGKTADQANFMINQMDVDRNFLKVMNLQLVSGTGFSGTPADSAHYIINEEAVRQMHMKDPVGKRFKFHDREGTIVGVVKDFHFQNMRLNIQPCILSYQNFWNWWRFYVKTNSNNAPQAIAAIQKAWKQYNPDYELEYQFLDQRFDEMYKNDIHVGELFNCFAGIAIIISCLGLFGLVTYMAETKIKEIGIRKTLGASISNIIVLLSKDFMKLVFISFLIAFPIAWFMMNKWLTNYAYRTELQWWVFAIAGACAFLIAFITVSSKAFRAAQRNPVKALRSE